MYIKTLLLPNWATLPYHRTHYPAVRAFIYINFTEGLALNAEHSQCVNNRIEVT